MNAQDKYKVNSYLTRLLMSDDFRPFDSFNHLKSNIRTMFNVEVEREDIRKDIVEYLYIEN